MLEGCHKFENLKKTPARVRKQNLASLHISLSLTSHTSCPPPSALPGVHPARLPAAPQSCPCQPTHKRYSQQQTCSLARGFGPYDTTSSTAAVPAPQSCPCQPTHPHTTQPAEQTRYRYSSRCSGQQQIRPWRCGEAVCWPCKYE